MKNRIFLLLLSIFIFSPLLGQPPETIYLGNIIHQGYDDDTGYGPYNIGFNFTFFGNVYSTFYVNTNGILTLGGSLSYRFATAFIAQASYTYAKNMKNIDALPDIEKHLLDPDIHQTVELSVLAMLIPRHKVNFYGILGATYFMNQRSANPDGLSKHYIIDNKVGLNTGIGFFLNFDLKSAGTLTFNGEWKVGFRFDKLSLSYDPRKHYTDPQYHVPTEVGSFSSVTRASLIWYLPFFK